MKTYILTEDQLRNILNAARQSMACEYNILDADGMIVEPDIEYDGIKSASLDDVVKEECGSIKAIESAVVENALDYYLRAMRRKHSYYKKKGHNSCLYKTLIDTIKRQLDTMMR